MKHLLFLKWFVLAIATILCMDIHAEVNYEFRKVQSNGETSNATIYCMLRDRQGFIWLGTSSGLERFDGYHFKTFHSRSSDSKSLLDDGVDEIHEDQYGLLWLHTSLGYCVYNPETEKFDRTPEEWMKTVGMSGKPYRLFLDSHKNIWCVVNGKGCYYFDAQTNKPFLFKMGRKKGEIPNGIVTGITENKGTVVLIYDDGTMVRLDARQKKPMWISTYFPDHQSPKGHTYKLHIDSQSNYWVTAAGMTKIYSPSMKRWFDTVPQWLKAIGVESSQDHILVRDIQEDAHDRLWIATDHNGLMLLNWKTKECQSFKSDKNNPAALSENSLNTLMLDHNGALWIGTYKNGAVYSWEFLSIFEYKEIGDVNAIAEDADGNWWLGTNDQGVICYNPLTGSRQHFRREKTHLTTDVIVSVKRAKDGSLWFGSFNGGLSRYKDGVWKAYHNKEGLAGESVWSLTELPSGNIVIGTLGSGVQILNPLTDEFRTYDKSNSNLESDFVSSVTLSKQGKILIAHSQGFSVLDHTTHKLENYTKTKSGRLFLNPQINQMYEDSRGLAWIATNSGLNILDKLNDELYELTADNGLGGTVACAITEDHHGNIWVSTDKGVAQVSVSRHGNRYDFSIVNYNHLDGLQERQFNFRSIFTNHRGDVLFGGQDGVNIFPEGRKEPIQAKSEVIFSGLILFDHPLAVGEEYDGHVILEKALNLNREIELSSSDNSFTIQLAATTIVVPARKRFYYRLKGLSDKWMMTPPNRNEVTFTNLSPGTYTLEVSIVGRDGHISKEVSTLKIKVNPPFYLSIWAFLIYTLLIATGLYYAYRLSVRRQEERFRVEQLERERVKDKELDEMKMKFFTNVSHELRSPLMLVLQPLGQLLKKEENPKKKNTLDIVHRNATKLLALVNQLLDFRKLEASQVKLNPVTGDIVNYLRNICRSFRLTQDKNIHLTFYSPMESLVMSFDDDKIGKVVNILLSNAYKFTKDDGRVDVSIQLMSKTADPSQTEDLLQIKVSDTGVGISDETKKHIFDRFYQVEGQEVSSYGGSGLGLSMVKDYVELHDGQVSVSDNAGQGTAFTIRIPIRHDVNLSQLKIDEEADANDSGYLADDATKHDDKAENQAATAFGEVIGSGKYEVLLVDDNRDFIDYMTTLFCDFYRLRVAYNGKEALQLIEDHKPDVIVSDVAMPEMNGLELCRALKSNFETAKIPFVLLTARVSPEQKIEGMESGADDYITKPFNFDLLNLRISNLIKWRNSTEQTKLDPQVKQIEITSLDEKLVQDATTYVEDNINNPDLSVESLSEAMNMSRVHLYKKLLMLTGSTPSEFIRLIRLRRAEQLLRQSQLSVAEVSYMVGFNNPRYFSKYFKEMYGMMPSQYKEAKKG